MPSCYWRKCMSLWAAAARRAGGGAQAPVQPPGCSAGRCWRRCRPWQIAMSSARPDRQPSLCRRCRQRGAPHDSAASPLGTVWLAGEVDRGAVYCDSPTANTCRGGCRASTSGCRAARAAARSVCQTRRGMGGRIQCIRPQETAQTAQISTCVIFWTAAYARAAGLRARGARHARPPSPPPGSALSASMTCCAVGRSPGSSCMQATMRWATSCGVRAGG